MYLRKLSLEFVACKLSLKRNWQGYVTSFSTSLVRYKSAKPNHHLFRYNLSEGISHNFFGQRDLHTTVVMGSSFSRGRKFSPEKNGPDRNPNVLLGHAKFCYTDPPRKREEFIEEVVCNESEIPENEMKVFDIGREKLKVLLIKQKGRIYATGTKCTHYGAPLVKGHLGNGRLRCQWHGACFNIESGDIEDFPGLDSLPCYEVKVSDGQVTVRAKKDLLQSNKRVLPFVKTVNPHSKTFIVVGGGPAGATCVETLRTKGYDGRLIFITGENHLPYDRIKLSKNLNVTVEEIFLRSLDFYQERNVEIKLGHKLSHLQATKKEIVLDNGQLLKYDKIFLATGSSPRHLEVNGSDLKNIFVLRTVEDARQIAEALSESSQVVVLGTSFIGMEVAAYCVDKVRSVVVVGKSVPFKATLGAEIGNRVINIFQEKGVQFQLNRTIDQFTGEGGKLKTVHLNDGTKLPADICILGIGTTPNTSYFDLSGIQRKPNGTVEVNDYLQTSVPDCFAGGEIATASVLGQKASIGHWGLASYHGQIAAFNMLGLEKPLRAVPFFWTMLFGKGIRYTGYAKIFDDTVIAGDLSDLAFIGFHCSGENVVAISTLNRDPLAAKFAEMLYEDKKLKKSQIYEWLSS